MSDRIAAAFAGSGKKAALMPYLMGGHPDLDTSRACLEAAIDAGADLIELGIPFSDPLADGPVIHEAGTIALQAGVKPGDVLALCREISERVPVLLMVYANVVLSHGGEDFARRAADAGAAGVVVPGPPPEGGPAGRGARPTARPPVVPLVAPPPP